MPVKKLREFLDKEGVKYVVMSHSKAFTAPEVAASAHISGREMAKTVMVKLDGHMVMVVLPANHRIDFEVLLGETNAEAADLASEAEFEDLFPGCEVGAMPPFGNLYGLKVWVEETLADSDMIAFNAGSHTEVIQLQFTEFEALVQPKLISALSNPATD